MAKIKTQIQISASIAGVIVAVAIFHRQISQYTKKFLRFLDLVTSITFAEYDSGGFQRNSDFAALETYLNAKQAKGFHGEVGGDSKAIVFTDEFQGVKLRWLSYQTAAHRKSSDPKSDAERFFRLEFHKKHYEIITDKYLKYIHEEVKAVNVQERPRKLYTNRPSSTGGGHSRRRLWTHVIFEHPATFDTLVMDPEKKREIIDDLINFSKSKEYYDKIGKVWKRGYLLCGPPGTGKSTLIAAMANFLKYDVYDLELAAVKDNTQLRELLINTSTKSIIVIEDIDCSLYLKGQRQKNDDGELDCPANKISMEKKKEKEKKKNSSMEKKKEKKNSDSDVTLSGLLNSIDGLWSSCFDEKIIVLKTNYIENLDPALIRTGRMDKHIKMSNMTPADVAENLMPNYTREDKDSSLAIKSVEEAKEKVQKKAEGEEKEKEVAEEKPEEVKVEKGDSVREEGEEVRDETGGWTAVGGAQSTSSSSQDKRIACMEGH